MADKFAVPKKPTKRKAVAPIGADAFASQQMSLFQTFLANTDDGRGDLSNAVDLWDAVPRYSVSRARMNDLRTAEGFLHRLEIPFQHRGRSFTVVVYPARVVDKDGKELSYYPSAREELVEHALRKIAADQQAGFFDAPGNRSGVRFSIYQLRKELEQQGHTLSYYELVDSLHILARSSVAIIATNEDGDEAFAESTYLSALTGVKRKTYDADPDARWAAQFHPLVTQSIDRLTYRQFNYRRLMKCRSQLARWLLSRLVLKYTQAGPMTPFEMRYSTIKRDSGLLSGYKVGRQAVAALDDAWEELRELGALSAARKNEQRGSRARLEDVIYTLTPTREFIAEQKAANRRQSDAKTTLAGAGSR